MNSREARRYIPEYANVLARAEREGWLAPLVSAHLLACTRETAAGLLNEIIFPLGPRQRLSVKFRGIKMRGRARFVGWRNAYTISLPSEPAPESCHLRVGLVLHEAAHVLHHLDAKHFNHGPGFCRALRRLLHERWTGRWREDLMVGETRRGFREIYGRHRGPYWLLLTREVAGKKGAVEHASDRAGLVRRGDGEKEKLFATMSAEEAHEEARTLVNDAKDNVIQAFVFSESESQFVGALYRRGETYLPWREERTADLAAVGLDDVAAPAAEDDEPPAEEPVVTRQALARTDRQQARVERVAAGPRPARRRVLLELDLGNAERWPSSKGADLVRAALEGGKSFTATDLAQLIEKDCAAVGVAFPASLVSRLKQAGFLREKTDE